MNLFLFRRKHKIKQKEFAKSIGVSQASLSLLEQGKIYASPQLALKIEEYTKKIDPNNYIKATELINPKKLKEFELISKVKK